MLRHQARTVFTAAAIAFTLLPTPSHAQQQQQGETGPNVPAFTVRPGYRVTLAAEKLEQVRFIESDGKGTLYVSQPTPGNIIALKDKDNDGVYETSTKFITGRKTAHGMHVHNGWLWFSQSGAIHRAQDKDDDGVADDVQTVLPDDSLPRGGGHWWRSILVTDQHIYTSIGDSTNATDESTSNPDRQKIWRFNHKGEEKTLFSSGVRNTEKLRMRPGTTEIWGIDHNSDNFGAGLGEVAHKNNVPGKQPITDVFPPEELNHYVEGGYYGHPILVGNRIPRIEFQKRPDLLDLAAKCTVPALQLGAHWAGNGWCFVTKDHFTPDHKGDIVAAFHGSWNSTDKVGYRVERIFFDKVTGRPFGHLPLVSTLANDGKTVLARPVDCTEAPDGSILFSCDATKRIFRITRTDTKATAATN